MNDYRKKVVQIMRVVLILAFSINVAQAQEYILQNEESTLNVLGTSSLHDWDIKAEQQSGKINFANIETGEIQLISFSVDAESLKSGKSSMDKNTYKALNTDSHKKIIFELAQVKSIDNKGEGEYAIDALGNLTIAGTKKQVPIKFTVSIANSQVKLVGEKKIKMTDFNVDPPKALFGTITTGDKITIKFSTIFK